MPKHVQLSTFQSWQVSDVLGIKTETTTGNVCRVVEVWCRICSKHASKIRGDSRLRGQAKSEIDIFVMGTTNVTKHSIMRHLHGSAHQIGLAFEKLNPSTAINRPSPSDTGSGSGTVNSFIGPQPKVNQALLEQSKNAYR